MSTLRLILADQLSDTLATLRDADAACDVIMFCELREEATYVKHHPKKIAFLFAAMRHFAEHLRRKGFTVRYVHWQDEGNTGSFEGEVQRALADHACTRVVVTEPGEYRLKGVFDRWQDKLGVPVELREDDRFLCSLSEFRQWAKGKKQLRMEFFYREMRKRYCLLLEADGTPSGGAWNYDKENRKPPKAGLRPPKRISHPKSSITQEVLALVEREFAGHFGTLRPFHYALTREEALQELTHFIEHLLPHFGDYQDAMLLGEPYLYHSLLSSYLNAGLLLPLEICQMAEAAYRNGQAPLNAVEGFIRQILGWREYVRGIYWLHMPEYSSLNYFGAQYRLPEFYWTANTRMACVREAVEHTRDHAYSHHIQRLMVTGNFALLAGINPVEVCEWYLLAYSDAYEWVELPNTLGMALFGDGGIMASKPYAASGKYIHRMSNFCERCAYDPEITVGDKACPFNALYWDFLARNEGKLRGNQRMPYVFATWDKMDCIKKKAIRTQAADVIHRMLTNTL